jgi:hypothetical protein
VSLTLLAAVAAAVAASVGYLSARRNPEAAGGGGGERRGPPGGGGEAVPWPVGLPLNLGDVVLVGAEERWLTGALVAREKTEIVAALFLAPEGAKQAAVAAFPPPRRDIFWLDPVAIDSPVEPPATLEIGGVTMLRRGRLPVLFERLGQGAPQIGAAGMIATYTAAESEVAIVVASEGQVYGWAGTRIEEGAYERLGRGGVDG